MSLNESQFNSIADEFLESLFDGLEEMIGEAADVDLQDGILNIELDAGGIYIINKHRPNKQIWLASPKSGASHYGYDEDAKTWIGTRDGANLSERLNDELSNLTGLKVCI